ncbi:TPA: RHS repeat-associated core domain-containing protein [Pseudomonas putida]
MLQSKKQLYFYSPEGLSLVKYAGAGASALLRAAGRTLAQCDDGQAGFYATDIQGSVMRFKGRELSSIRYAAYGYDDSKPCASLLRYGGQRKEFATGHYVLGGGYRAFIPVLMRFNSPDSLSPFGAGGHNSYSYCGADPVNNLDPTGHMIKAIVMLKNPTQTSQSLKRGYPPPRDGSIADVYWNNRFEKNLQNLKSARARGGTPGLESALSTSPLTSRPAVSIEAAKITGAMSPTVVNDLKNVKGFLAGQINNATLLARAFKAKGPEFYLHKRAAEQVAEELLEIRMNLPSPTGKEVRR